MFGRDQSKTQGEEVPSPEGLPPTAPPPANEVKIDPKTVEAAEKRPSKADPKNAVRKYV